MAKLNHRRKNKVKVVGKPCGEARWYGHTKRCSKACRYCSGNRTISSSRQAS